MREPLRNPELTLVCRAEADPDPAAEAGRIAAQIHRDIEHFPGDHAHQLSLGLLDLVVQPAQNATLGLGMIVLDELPFQARGFLESGCVEAFIEETAFIPENLWFDDQHVWNAGLDHFHASSPASLKRYWP